MKRFLISLCLPIAASAAAASGDSRPADPAAKPAASVVSPSAKAAKSATPPKAADPFSKPVVLKGMLGDQRIQASIRPKTDPEEGVEGEYFYFGQSKKILLAGELDKEEFWMEESENGTDVSGQWEGKKLGDRLEGRWTSPDGAVTKPFVLQIIRTPDAGARPPRSGNAKAGTPALSQPAAKPVSQ